MYDYSKIPKVEFHRHLDGSVRFNTILDIAKKNQLNLGVPLDSSKGNNSLYQKCKIVKPMQSLEAVLDSFWTTQKVFCNPEAIKRIAYENVEDCYRDGVVLGELRFAPTFIQEGKNIDLYDIIISTLEGIDLGVKEFEIVMGLIFIVPRTLSLEKSRKALEIFLDIKKSNHPLSYLIVGFDLADGELERSKKDFVPLVNMARDNELGITIHTGESSSADDVRETIELMKPQRIGHGVKIEENDKVIDLVRSENILLELCPTSNWLTRSVASLASHPLKSFHEKKLAVSINSDDPHLMDIDLLNEYRVCHEILKLEIDDFYKINKRALDYSFIDNSKVNRVKKKYFFN